MYVIIQRYVKEEGGASLPVLGRSNNSFTNLCEFSYYVISLIAPFLKKWL